MPEDLISLPSNDSINECETEEPSAVDSRPINGSNLHFTHTLFIMNLQALRIIFGKISPNQTQKIKLLFLLCILVLLTIIKLNLHDGPGLFPIKPPEIKSDVLSSKKPVKECNIFSGRWVENPNASFYNKSACDFQMDLQNCGKYGRRDEEFLKWRWTPDDCELPLFDGAAFLEVLRGKAIAFVGDSIAKNQMHSLLCLLSSVASPEEIYKHDTFDLHFRSWFYAYYNATISTFWSPLLVKNDDLGLTNSSSPELLNVYLDEADELWTTEIKSFDYVVISGGIWFLRPSMVYENGRLVGCHLCNETNITKLETSYVYRKAFRTALMSLNRLENFKGVTFLRTISPAHYENGQWNSGGTCRRKQPLSREDTTVQPDILQMREIQTEELAEAEKKGSERGLKFRVLNVTEAMAMRPDGHPNHYVAKKNATIADCVHWCLPGPIDSWNAFLLYLLKYKN